MFNTITWQQYFFFLGFALAVYYIAVVITYFKWDLLALAGIQKEDRTKFSSLPIANSATATQNGFNQGSDMDLSAVLQDFRDEIAAFVTEAVTGKLSQDEFIHGLKSIVIKYPVLNTANQVVYRNEIIAYEMKETPFSMISLTMLQ